MMTMKHHSTKLCHHKTDYHIKWLVDSIMQWCNDLGWVVMIVMLGICVYALCAVFVKLFRLTCHIRTHHKFKNKIWSSWSLVVAAFDMYVARPFQLPFWCNQLVRVTKRIAVILSPPLIRTFVHWSVGHRRDHDGSSTWIGGRFRCYGCCFFWWQWWRWCHNWCKSTWNQGSALQPWCEAHWPLWRVGAKAYVGRHQEDIQSKGICWWGGCSVLCVSFLAVVNQDNYNILNTQQIVWRSRWFGYGVSQTLRYSDTHPTYITELLSEWFSVVLLWNLWIISSRLVFKCPSVCMCSCVPRVELKWVEVHARLYYNSFQCYYCMISDSMDWRGWSLTDDDLYFSDCRLWQNRRVRLPWYFTAGSDHEPRKSFVRDPCNQGRKLAIVHFLKKSVEEKGVVEDARGRMWVIEREDEESHLGSTYFCFGCCCRWFEMSLMSRWCDVMWIHNVDATVDVDSM